MLINYQIRIGGDLLSKNTRIALASVGVIVTLIIGVLLIRSPSTSPENTVKKKTAETEVQQEQNPPKESINANKEYDESHKKIAEGLDQASDIVVKQVPGLWEKIKNTWAWFMKFETKHFVILVIAVIAIFVAVAGTDRGRNQKKKG